MSKVRVVYKPDGKVSVIHPAPQSQRPNETEEEWLERVFSKAMQDELKGLPYDDMDVSKLPPDRKDRDKWRGKKGKGIRIDHSVVLPREVIEQRQQELDKELAKTKPDPVKVIRLHRDIEKLREQQAKV